MTEEPMTTKPIVTISELLSSGGKDGLDAFNDVNQNITGIELFNSIYNLWIHYFNDAASYVALKNKKMESYAEFQNKLFENGYTKILSAMSSDARSAYFINHSIKSICYVSIGNIKDIGDSGQITVPPYGVEQFYASFCSCLNDGHADFMKDIIDFYATLKDVEKVDPKNAFYMIASSAAGLKKIPAECKPKPIKDDRFDLYYGKSFPINILKDFMQNEQSQNLMLLHGDPGTGKSNMIRHLIQHSDRNIIYIPPSMAASISQPSFIEFIMENRKSILLIEDAEEILSKDRNAATNNLLGLTDGFLKDALDLKIIATFNKDINDIDSALRRPGRLFFEYKFNKLSGNEVQDLCDFVEIDIPEKDITDMTLAEIFGYGQVIRQDTSLNQRSIGFGQ